MDSESEVFAKKLTQTTTTTTTTTTSSSNNSNRSKDREISSSALVAVIPAPACSTSARKTCSSRSRPGRPRETEEEAIIRRFHDAQRMARFRARKKKALEDQQQQLLVDGKNISNRKSGQNDSDPERQQTEGSSSAEGAGSTETESKYTQLLAIIERLGKDVRLSYAGSRSSAERLKSGIVRARTLVRYCLIETRLNLRQ